MTAETVSLDDKYALAKGRVFITGTQALVRLPLAQARRDQVAGLNTAGYISGYRGSPLGAYDDQLHKEKARLDEHRIVFQPGVNEDLAATAVWGSQQSEASGESRYDGVFAIWYGKGPGVDRSGDAFRHGNLAGSSARGGVLVLTGDDHTCESSTTCHQSEFALVDAMLPVLSPAGVQELIDYGLAGWALSRYSGCWVGLKCVKDTVDATAVIDVDDTVSPWVTPTDATLPPGGFNLRFPDTPHAQEARLHQHKLGAAQAWVRANRIDRTVFDAPQARFGIVASGKSYLDVRQAFEDLGLDPAALARLGVRVYKPALVWPLEPQGALRFAEGLSRIVVVEEKRALIETQLKELLYGRAAAPTVVGKRDEQGRVLFQPEMALDAVQIAVALGERLAEAAGDAELAARVAVLKARRAPAGAVELMERRFYFCSGCPHNSSTVLPEGSRGYAGIGCSWMAQFMERSTLGYTQMGAEGMSWVGEAPFSKRRHVFQNIGDGTYFHSGLLAIRAAVAAKTNITFKILFNDAVAMTGGQEHDGPLNVPIITRQVAAEGVERIEVVTDEPQKYAGVQHLAPGVRVHHRDRIQAVQRELREVPGTTVLVYDQTCAAEKRRRRKRGEFPDPPKRLFIHSGVCEGCGDCGVQSNCVSLVPVETEFGRKRAIDQSSCNKDFSCLKGFCPSFVTVHGGSLRRPKAASAGADVPLPEPVQPPLNADAPSYSIVITGVGGTGVVTIGAVLGMAAHLDGLACSILDMAGLAQKGGSVWSHLRLGVTPQAIPAVRIGPGGADLLLGCDLVVAAQGRTLGMLRVGASRALVNTQEVMPGDFTRQPDMAFPGGPLARRVAAAVGEGRAGFVDAGRLATALLGDSVATNMFMLGHAWQRGLVPVSAGAIRRAIELNGAAVQMNLAAFGWGRRSVVDPAAVERAAARDQLPRAAIASTLDERVERRAEHLTAYQDVSYAKRYLTLVERVRTAERRLDPLATALTEAVAISYHKLLAIKDEYEVARLYTAPEFRAALDVQFDGDFRVEFNLAPPLLSRVDPETGRPRKLRYGAWMLTAFALLARLRRLRGTVWDPFGRTAERRMERRLIGEYEALIDRLLAQLEASDRAVAVELAALPQKVRGFGPVKQASVREFELERARLLGVLKKGDGAMEPVTAAASVDARATSSG